MWIRRECIYMDTIQDNRKGGLNKLNAWIAKVRKIKNIEIVVAVILLAIILIVYTGYTGAKAKRDKSVNTAAEKSDSLEQKMEKILSEISGAGKVSVMITYKGSVEYVTANTSNVNTNTTTDISRTTSTTSQTISPVIINSNGSSGPIIIKEIMPEVKGVIVVAEGAGNVIVRLELIRAVMVALDIGAEDIEIFTKQ